MSPAITCILAVLFSVGPDAITYSFSTASEDVVQVDMLSVLT